MNTDLETSSWSHLPRAKSLKLHLQLRPENRRTGRDFKKRRKTEHIGCLHLDPRGGGGKAGSFAKSVLDEYGVRFNHHRNQRGKRKRTGNVGRTRRKEKKSRRHSEKLDGSRMV